ncbi:MAG TPA: class I SAM-dependent rRNA methyltransferase [Humidesulfovibrio sp.]|uniref:class I SAM-dependent rRNA methyltransferase n=1 Tax=Humidesulfovibrio sp. TaxID=2910988 RepID=UPI002C03AE89|nr:class I SAM-dependent rRNA methyltransferase [Humidesulfovibrio sp.]HWR03318.1 class I SAM-dependent rRNA methyltransferase [Humidesulfovibrio sp.]
MSAPHTPQQAAGLRTLALRKNEDRRLNAGHLWIFSNEVDVAKTPLTGFAPGECARVESSQGRPLGSAYVNPGALIAGRVYCQDATRPLDAELLRSRLRAALSLREDLYAAPYYRLVFGEADRLPGLVVDRFGEVLAVQIGTAGMERLRADIVAILGELLSPAGILLKNDLPGRELEGLARGVEVAAGDVPEDAVIEENGCRFTFPLAGGQKTGWFYDMRETRAMAASLSAGRQVLDVFSYAGGLGIACAHAGAERAVCLDASGVALSYAAKSAELSGVADRVEILEADALAGLKELRAQGRRFGLVSVDPPAFVKRRKDMEKGLAAYRTANRLALELVEDGGFLIACSCSQHVGRDDLRKVLAGAARDAGVRLSIVRQCHQAADHPIHPAMPETEYLKGFLCRVTRPGKGL